MNNNKRKQLFVIYIFEEQQQLKMYLFDVDKSTLSAHLKENK